MCDAVKGPKGRHIITELSGCNPAKLQDLEAVRAAMLEAAQRAKATVLDVCLHHFQPQGVSGVVVVAESHISIHTWPELGYAALDVYTCGEATLPEAGSDYLAEFFEARAVVSSSILRGEGETGAYGHYIKFGQKC